MKSNKKGFKILIFVLIVIALFQAVSIGFLWMKNMKLKEAANKRAKIIKVVKIIHPSAIKTVYTKEAVPEHIKSAVAIVLDDWGYSRRNINDLFALAVPVTISVLPNLPFSKSIANEAHANNVEVILHLPLEAHDSQKKPEKWTIYTSMNKKEVLAKLSDAIAAVPYIKGVSNHMGSKATEDEALVRLLFVQLKKRNLYFLDSLVTPKTVCRKIAYQESIKFAERSVFLDNNNDIDYIKGQLRLLLIESKSKKMAIGIGHDRRFTIKAIKEMIPEFDKEGVKFVYLSEVVR